MHLALAAVLAVLTACSPTRVQAEESGTENAEAGITATGAAAAATEGGIPQRLTALGFYVFPEPVSFPSFTVPDLSGAPLNSDSFAGKITLLNFWATWCPPCKREMPSIERLHLAMRDEQFRVAAISTGEKPATVLQFIKNNAYTLPVFLDENGSLGAAFASQGIPSTYILNKDGKIIAGIVGSREYDDPALIAVLQELARQ